MNKERKAFQFDLKAADLHEDGTFRGLASTYGNVDLGDDVVVSGAFTKNLQDRGDKRPLLWSHKTDKPIGISRLEDTKEGLVIKGELNLDLQEARDAYSNLKKGIVGGLSIGFETVKKELKDGVRHLQELKLFEVSLCVFPMNEMASVQTVKELDAATLHEAIELGEKVGRRHSAATLARLAALATQANSIALEIQTLLSDEAAGHSTSPDGAVAVVLDKAATPTNEPDLKQLFHSLMRDYSRS